VFLRTLVCLFDYFVYCTSMHSYICIVASHIGTLAETCEGCGVGANPKMELVDPSRRQKDRTSARLEDARQASSSDIL
jgi:hypothetical protein